MGFFDQRCPLVFAHRGGCALGPENTIEGFDRGIRAGADGLELDVRMSADGHPVVIHDATLDRTTNATGPVSHRTVAELARLDAASSYSEHGALPLRGAGVGIPTLADVLARHVDRPVIVEMKDDNRALGEAVARVVRAADAVHRVCAAGFGSSALWAARRALPDMATSAHRTRDTRCRKAWVACESCHPASSDMPTVPGCPFRCGPWTRRTTWPDCSPGAWMQSSAIGPTRQRHSCDGGRSWMATTPPDPPPARLATGTRATGRNKHRGGRTLGSAEVAERRQVEAGVSRLRSYASACSCAWYELRTRGPDSTCTKPLPSARCFSSENSSGW
jgi:hypothetical protein